MTQANEKNQHKSSLRAAAEEQLANAPVAETPAHPAEKLLHELQLHQIELEMQNQNLRCAQGVMEEMRDRYMDLYEFAPVGYLSLTRAGTISDVNLTGAALLGVERKKLLNDRFSHFVTPEHNDQWEQYFLTVLRRDGRQSCELVLKRTDGSCFDARITSLKSDDSLGTRVPDDSAPLPGKSDAPLLLRIFITDISEHKRAETERRKALDRFQKITQLVPGVVYQFRLRPDGSASMPFVSDAFHNLFRLNPAEVRENASKALMRAHPDDLENLMASIQASARDLTPWQHEYRLKFGDGTVRWVLGNSLPQLETDGSTLWHGFITDVTERKQAEESLRAEQEIRASRKAVRKLSAHVEELREAERKVIAREVHDELGQVLSVLRMNIALLKDKTGMNNPVMDGIERNMLALVDRAIQGVRNVASSLRPIQMDMGSVTAIEWLCTEFSRQSGIPCSLEVAGDIGNLSEFSALALYRIVQESLTNITRHADATCVGIAIATRDGAIEVEIRDNGKGFDMEERVGDKSFGLLGMHERAISIGGELNVTSRPEQGTVVTLRIPDNPTCEKEPADTERRNEDRRVL